MATGDNEDHDLHHLIPMIDAFLRSCGTDSKFDQEDIKFYIEEIFAYNLDAYRKEFFEIAKQRIDLFGDVQKAVMTEEQEADDRRKFLKKLSQEMKKKPVKDKEANRKKVIKKLKTSNPLNTKKMLLSPQLQNLLGGQTELARTEIVKGIWAYVRKHNLQNPRDRKEILCDKLMQAVFGRNVTIFSMNKILLNHITDPRKSQQMETGNRTSVSEESASQNEEQSNFDLKTHTISDDYNKELDNKELDTGDINTQKSNYFSASDSLLGSQLLSLAPSDINESDETSTNSSAYMSARDDESSLD